MELQVVARIRTDFPTKFGVPRQSGITDTLLSEVIFEPEYRNADALRGIEGYSHLWLLWGFSEVEKENWSPTVRPPRLGGNTRMGVFATRSPFRPNKIGLSSVRLIRTEDSPEGICLIVSGADMVDGTPIYDIKPYIPYTDCHPDALGGFSDGVRDHRLDVSIPPEIIRDFPEEKRAGLTEVLSQDPRPAYIDDPERVYGLLFGGFEIKFTVSDGVASVISVRQSGEKQ